MRPIVIDVDESSNAKAWWQRGTLNVFRGKIHAMSKAQLEVLSSEIGARLAVIQGQIQGGMRETAGEEWFQAAKMSIGYIAERRNILSAELARRNVDQRAERARIRNETLGRARERLAADDLHGAIGALIDLLAPRDGDA
jgi:hypothetical protein